MNRIVALATLIIGLLWFNVPDLFAVPTTQDDSQSSQPTVLELEVQFEEKGNPNRPMQVANLDVGKLQLGKRYSIKLNLASNSDQVHVFDDVKTSGTVISEGGESRLSFTRNEIASNDSGTAILELEMPKATSRKVLTVHNLLQKGRGIVGQVLITVRVAEDIDLGKEWLVVDATAQGFEPINIPFQYLPHITKLKCDVTATDGLKPVIDADVETLDEGHGQVVIQPAKNFFMECKFHKLQIKLYESNLGVERIIGVRVQQFPPMEVFPTVLVFKEDENGKFVANALVQCKPEVDVNQFRLKLREIEADISVQNLPGNIKRLRLELDEDSVDGQSSGTCVWRVDGVLDSYDLPCRWVKFHD